MKENNIEFVVTNTKITNQRVKYENGEMVIVESCNETKESYVLEEVISKGPLKELIIPDSITSIKEGALNNLSESLENITFSKNMNKIPSNICTNFKKLKSVTIPDSVKVIEGGAFRGTELEIINISENSKLETLYWGAFANTKIKNVDFLYKLKHLKNIYDNAFSNTSIDEFIITDTIARHADTNAFDNMKIKRLTINVPDRKVRASYFTFRGSEITEEITINFNGHTFTRSIHLPKVKNIIVNINTTFSAYIYDANKACITDNVTFESGSAPKKIYVNGKAIERKRDLEKFDISFENYECSERYPGTMKQILRDNAGV